MNISRILCLLFLGSAVAADGLAAGAGDPKLVASWDYVNALSDGHFATAEGSLDLKANGSYADSRRIQGPRTKFGADTEGRWMTSGDTLDLMDADGKLVGRMTYFLGTTTRGNTPFVTLTLKGDGLTYLLAHKAR